MRMSRGEFIALSASSMMLTALGIDIMLPALGSIREEFGLSENSTATAQVIMFFFMGQIAQIVFGIFSDRFGRLPILKVGFPLYIVGGVIAAYAPTLEWMFAARFVAGMGASAVFMTTIAGVRDRFVGDEMARIMSLVITIFLFTPVMAPFLGLAILQVASWRIVFLTAPLFAVIVFLWSFRLEESLPVSQRSELKRKTIWRAIRTVLTNKTFLRYTLVTTILFTALSTWVASSEHIVGTIFGKPGLFAWIFAAIGLVMSLSALTNSRLARKYGARRSIKSLMIVYFLVAAGLMLYTLITGDPPGMMVFFISVAILMAVNLAIEPNSSALAMEPMGNMAGIASAVYGTMFFFIGSTLGSLISHLMSTTVVPIILSFLLIGITGLF
ncbi:MAG: MFS transporter, partial [Chitinophagaceae bacterium]